jgi:hypothetical protein
MIKLVAEIGIGKSETGGMEFLSPQYYYFNEAVGSPLFH